MLDKFRETAITWDKASRKVYEPLRASAGDNKGRKLSVQVVNNSVVENLSGATLSLYWETKSKTYKGLDAFTAVDATKGEFEIYYTTGMLSNEGTLNANLVLVDTSGRVVSEPFTITVFKGIDDNAIQSSDSFTALTEALAQIGNINGKADKAELQALKSTTEQSLLSLEQQLTQTEKELDTKADKFNTMTQAEFDSWVATLLGGRPSMFFDTLATLKATHPEGAPGVALVRETNPPKIYAWSGSEWKYMGDYTGIELGDQTVLGKMIQQDPMNLTKLNYTEGTIWDGIVAAGANTAALLDYYFVPKGTVIEPSPLVEYKIYRYNEAKAWIDSANPGWSRTKTVIEKTCLIRWAVKYRTSADFTGANTTGPMLNIYKTPQMDYLEKEITASKKNKVGAARLDKEFLNNFFEIQDGTAISWELGTLSASGSGGDSANRMRTGYFPAVKGSTIDAINTDRYKYAVYYYDDSTNFIETTGFLQQERYTFKRDGLVRLLHARVTDGPIVAGDEPGNKYEIRLLSQRPEEHLSVLNLEKELLQADNDILTESDIVWEAGTITGTGGNAVSTARMRTGFIPAKKGSVISLLDPTAYKWGMFEFDQSYTLKETKPLDTTKAKTVETDGYIRLLFAYRSNADLGAGFNPSDYLQIRILQEKTDSDEIYAREYLPEIEKTKHDYRRDYSKNRIGFAFITDLHVDTISQYNMAMRQLRALAKISEETDLAFVAVGGDIHSGNLADKEETKQRMEDVLQGLHSIGKPILIARGNHDDNSFYYTGSEAQWGNTIPINNIIGKDEWNSFAISPYRNEKMWDKTETYFYQDFAEHQTRAIVLDWIDYGVPLDSDGDGYADRATTGYGYNGFGEAQVKWFAQTLLDTPNDYQVIIFTHGPTRGELNNANYTPIFSTTVNDILNAFNTKQTLSYGGKSYDYGFGGRIGKIIGLFYGHVHADKMTVYPEIGNIPMVATGCSLFRTGNPATPIPGYDYQPNREKSTITEALFDIVSINPGTVKAFRFGAGPDREINF